MTSTVQHYSQTVAVSIEVPTITPVRRLAWSIPQFSPVDKDEPPWTSSRCHRLLRPLHAAIIELRKQRYKRTDSRRPRDAASNSQNAQPPISAATLSILTSAHRSRLNDDPDWAPRLCSRKTTKTYGARTRARRPLEKDVEKHSHLSIAAAMSQILDQVSYEDCPQTKEQTSSRAQQQLAGNVSKDEFRIAARAVSETNFRLYTEIYTALESSLTRTREPQRSPGPSSLLKACLRAVPKRIALEQKLELEDGPDSKVNMSDVIYSELEGFGTSQEAGWRLLRTVVRSHGIEMLGEAIVEGLIPPRISQWLLKLCYKEKATEEAEQLVKSMLASVKAVAVPTSADQTLFCTGVSETLLVLKEYWAQANAWGHLFRALALQLEQRILPVSWMGAPDMAEIWIHVVDAIAQNDHSSVFALKLLRITLSLSCWSLEDDVDSVLHMCRLHTRQQLRIRLQDSTEQSSQGSLTRMVSNVTAILVALSSVKQNAVFARQIHTTFAEIVHDMQRLQHALIVSGRKISMPESRRFCYLTYSWTMLCKQTDQDTSYEAQLSSAWAFALSSEMSLSDLAMFGCTAVRYCEKIDPEAGHRYARCAVDALVQVCEPSSTLANDSIGLGRTIRRMAADLAFAYAEWSQRQSDLDWALEFQELYVTEYPNRNLQQPKKNIRSTDSGSNASSFMWEESIGEWIVNSPIVNKHGPRNLPGVVERRSPSTQRIPISDASDCNIEDDASIASEAMSHASPRHIERINMSLLDMLTSPSYGVGNKVEIRAASHLLSPASTENGRKFDLDCERDDIEVDELSASPAGVASRRQGARRRVLLDVTANERADKASIEAKVKDPKPRARRGPKRQRSEPWLGASTCGDWHECHSKRRRSEKMMGRGRRAKRDSSSNENCMIVLDCASESEDELSRIS